MSRLKKIGEILAILIIVVFSLRAFADVTVSASVDRNVLSPEDSLTYTINVQSTEDVSVGQPSLSQLSDFEILNQWTSQEARASFVNTQNGPEFRTVRATHYNYMLQPKREGNLTIGDVAVVVEGKSYKTKPVSIRVAKGASQLLQKQGRARGGGVQPPSGVQAPPGFLDDDEADDLFSQLLKRHLPQAGGSRTLPINPQEAFFVQVDTDKTEAYVGEQITVSFYLYTRGQIRDLDTLKYPSLKGFWKEDIEIASRLNFTDEVVNGIPYKKALLASYALFPLKEGSATVDSYTAKCTVVPANDAFGALGFGKAYTFTKTSQPIKVTVKPLPTDGRPNDFSGAVGSFQVTSRVEDNNIVANQPFIYKIRFEGKGNAKLIELPPFQPPEGMELYNTDKEAKFFPTGTSYKDFLLQLIPRREGDFTIPPVTVSLFDPQQNRYVTKTTEAVRVHVAAGAASVPGAPAAVGLTVPGEAEAAVAAKAVPGLALEYQASRNITTPERSIFYVALMALIASVLLWRARTELGWGQKKKDLQRRLRARIRRVNECADRGDWRGVGVEMTNSVYFVLGEIAGQGGADVELEKLMLRAPPSIRREIAGPLAKQMETFHILSFAPEEVVGKLKEPAQLKSAISEMTKLMEKTVALGVSSEQLDESGSNPTAS